MSPPDATRGRITWYGLWQLRDYVVDRGVSTVLIGLILGTQFVLPLRMGLHATLGDGWATEPTGRAMLLVAVPQLVMTFALLGTLIAMNGIVSNDRRHGYVRFLFAKPVSVVRYYLQAFAASIVGLMVATAVLAGLFAVIVAPLVPIESVAVVGIVAVGVGGIGFLLSTIVRGDWLFLSLVLGMTAMLRGIFGRTGDWREAALVVLPPLHRLDDIRDRLLGGTWPAALDIGWVAGYGMACVVLGIIVLRRRPLAS